VPREAVSKAGPGPASGAIGGPEAARQLARVFYRRLRTRGLSEGEIMTAASEILGCLCDDLDGDTGSAEATDGNSGDPGAVGERREHAALSR
jgi:hypothetical protein